MDRRWTTRAWRRAAGACALAVACAVVPAPADAESLQSAQERAKNLRAELADLRKQVATAVEEYEQAEAASNAAVSRSVQLGQELEVAQRNAVDSGAQLRARVSALYRAGGRVSLLANLMAAKTPADLVGRVENVNAVVRADSLSRDVSAETGSQLAAVEGKARTLATSQAQAQTRMSDAAARITRALEAQTAALAAADATVRRLVEEQRAAARAVEQARLARLVGTTGPVPDGAYAGPPGACPVGESHSFVDTWHAPRSGGRQHQGTDVFAPEGSPAYAVVDGVIDKWSTGGLGGVALWLRGANGDRYYYAHNTQNLAFVGQQVKAGDIIATVGRTGNAETTPAHIHFEAHPGGGAAANPYPWLAGLCAS